MKRIPETFDEALGMELARQRKGKGVTQVALAIQLGWLQPTLCKIETGRQRATALQLLQICRALDIDALTVSTKGWL